MADYMPLGLSDEMPFGQYKGRRLIDILAFNGQYVVWLSRKGTAFTDDVLELANEQVISTTAWSDEGVDYGAVAFHEVYEVAKAKLAVKEAS